MRSRAPARPPGPTAIQPIRASSELRSWLRMRGSTSTSWPGWTSKTSSATCTPPGASGTCHVRQQPAGRRAEARLLYGAHASRAGDEGQLGEREAQAAVHDAGSVPRQAGCEHLRARALKRRRRTAHGNARGEGRASTTMDRRRSAGRSIRSSLSCRSACSLTACMAPTEALDPGRPDWLCKLT